MPGLSLLVLTHNEAPRLRRCLETFRSACDELVVVDSGSTDGTVELARESADQVHVRDWPGRAPQTNWAIAQLKTDWFFQVDADEAATPPLLAELREVTRRAPDEVGGYSVDRLEWFMGRLVRCGRHRKILRLCRTARAEMPLQRAHAYLQVSGEVGQLRAPLMHYVDQPLDELLTKLTRRGLLSAEDYRDRGLRSSYAKLWWHPLATFLRLWVLKGGCFDGLPGLVLSGLRTSYCFTRMARLLELQAEPEPR